MAHPTTPTARGNKIFVVHGHDSGLKETVARFISQLAFEPVILHERPNEGTTIIEKFERHSQDVSFAFVLLTPDDKRGVAERDPGTYQPRARQNVILEFGYFLGSLGRRRVCASYSPGVELPSDIGGLLYIPIDSGNGWRLRLAREIKASGVDVDLDKAISSSAATAGGGAQPCISSQRSTGIRGVTRRARTVRASSRAGAERSSAFPWRRTCTVRPPGRALVDNS